MTPIEYPQRESTIRPGDPDLHIAKNRRIETSWGYGWLSWRTLLSKKGLHLVPYEAGIIKMET